MFARVELGRPLRRGLGGEGGQVALAHAKLTLRASQAGDGEQAVDASDQRLDQPALAAVGVA